MHCEHDMYSSRFQRKIHHSVHIPGLQQGQYQRIEGGPACLTSKNTSQKTAPHLTVHTLKLFSVLKSSLPVVRR